MNSKKQKYWYRTDIYACVLCGREHKYRYRVYDTPKPKNTIFWFDDACSTHF